VREASFVTGSAGETQRLAGALGALVRAGDVVALDGELGAGKTCFVQGLASGLGVPANARVASPTFTLVNEHHGGRLVLYHVDLYRLERRDELEQIGLAEILGGPGVCAVEWMERFPEFAPRDRLALTLTITGDEARSVRAQAYGAAEPLLDAWAAAARKLAPTR
jgi:tRNA threonylcarbamoyladenosine biosynthesis protein TsaE